MWGHNLVSFPEREGEESNIGCVSNAIDWRLAPVFDLSSNPYAGDYWVGASPRQLYCRAVSIGTHVRPQLMLAGHSDLFELTFASVPESVSGRPEFVGKPSNSDGRKGSNDTTIIVEGFADMPEDDKASVIRGAVFVTGIFILVTYISIRWSNIRNDGNKYEDRDGKG
jgi:hypothetical protein